MATNAFSPLTSTHHSLFHALETYLTYIKDRLACAAAECHKQGPSGWNSWMLATRHVRQLAETLCGVMLWVSGSIALRIRKRVHLFLHSRQALPTPMSSHRVHPLYSRTYMVNSWPFWQRLRASIILLQSPWLIFSVKLPLLFCASFNHG